MRLVFLKKVIGIQTNCCSGERQLSVNWTNCSQLNPVPKGTPNIVTGSAFKVTNDMHTQGKKKNLITCAYQV